MRPGEARRARHWRGFLAPALLAALVLPALAWRADLESSLWMDEVHSLQMAHLAPARIVDQAARDAHPPGYFLALKAWLAAGRRLGIEPELGWARGLGVLLWLALAAAVWALMRRLAGSRAAGVATWAVAGGAVAGQLAVELRGYFFVFAAAVVAWLAARVAEQEAAAGRTPAAAGAWALYAALAAAALWTHLLAAPLFALIGAAWLASRVGGWAVGRAGVPTVATSFTSTDGSSTRRPGTRTSLALGLAAHLVILLLWSPWLLRLPGQLARFAGVDTGWMTPADGRQLALLFTRWFALGRAAAPEGWPVWGPELLGVAALAVPLAGALWASARRWRSSLARRGRGGLGNGVAALAVAAAFSLLLWCLARFDLAEVFHGPRYPMLAAGLWALGVAGLALLGRRPWLLLAPWLLAAVVGHVLALRQAARGGLPAARPAIEAALAAPDEPLYVSPTELAPFVAESLAGLRVRPVEEVACGLVEHGRAVVLDVSPWPSLERVRDRVWVRAANRGLLAAEWRWEELPPPALGATLLSASGAGRQAPGLCERKLAPPRPWRGEPEARALPEDQLHADGWATLELGRDLVPRRWATAARATLRFDRPLPPGRYALYVVGQRAAAPRAVEEVCVRPPGGGEERCFAKPAGRFEIVLPFEATDRLRRPRATIRHPAWSPAEAFGTGDRRRLSVMLEAAWIERRE